MLAILKRLFVGFILLSNAHMGYAQLVVDGASTPEELVEDILLGAGVTVSNITFTGEESQRGYFDGSASNIGIDGGVMLSSGDIEIAIGPNVAGGAGLGVGGLGDDDLETLSGVATFDAVILEFDFVPTGDSINFDYVFASEEYNEYACGTVNDVFGFFLSGPGIAGPFTNGAINIALIPGTTTPVSINTVNIGVAGDNGIAANCDALDPDWPTYNTFFTDNPGGPSIEYDGFTVPLTASAEVVCGETYHIKLALSDGGDGVFDSGVFLEENGFSSNAVEVEITTLSADSAIVEGCTTANIILTRPNADSTIVINMVIEGDAINGVDYEFVHDTLVFEMGEHTAEFEIIPIDDGIPEDRDTIIITVFSINICGDTVPSTGMVFIQSDYELVAESENPTIQCPGDSVIISAIASGGNAPYYYDWNTGQQGDSIWVTPTETTTYYVNLTDSCIGVGMDSVTVIVDIPAEPTVNVSPSSYQFGCPGESLDLSASPAFGAEPYSYNWSTGETTQDINIILNTDTLFWVEVTDVCGTLSNVDTVLIDFIPPPNPVVSIDPVTYEFDCAGEVLEILADPTQGQPPYIYNWSNGATTSSINVTLTNDTVYWVEVTDACGTVSSQSSMTITFNPANPPEVDTSNDPTLVCPDEEATLTAVASQGNPPYTYAWSTGENGSSIMVNPNITEDFTVTITDNCGAEVEADITVTVIPYQAIELQATDDYSVQCAGDAGAVQAIANLGREPYVYSWDNGMSGDLINVSFTESSTLTVTVTDDCGFDATDELNITVPIYDMQLTVIEDSTICENTFIDLFAEATGGAAPYSYVWTGLEIVSGAEQDTALVANTYDVEIPQDSLLFNYSITVTDQCDENREHTLDLWIRDCTLIVPNVFTPDGDEYNQNLVVANLDQYPNSSIVVYNRWGICVYESENYLNDWDGDGRESGVYYYVLSTSRADVEPMAGYVHMITSN
jgi:gliding motility-associated-like protein